MRRRPVALIQPVVVPATPRVRPLNDTRPQPHHRSTPLSPLSRTEQFLFILSRPIVRKRRRGEESSRASERASAVPNLGGVYARPEILEIAVYFPAEGIELATLRVTPRPHPVVFLDGKAKPAARPSLLSPPSRNIARVKSNRFSFHFSRDTISTTRWDGTSRAIRVKKWWPASCVGPASSTGVCGFAVRQAQFCICRSGRYITGEDEAYFVEPVPSERSLEIYDRSKPSFGSAPHHAPPPPNLLPSPSILLPSFPHRPYLFSISTIHDDFATKLPFSCPFHSSLSLFRRPIFFSHNFERDKLETDNSDFSPFITSFSFP